MRSSKLCEWRTTARHGHNTSSSLKLSFRQLWSFRERWSLQGIRSSLMINFLLPIVLQQFSWALVSSFGLLELRSDSPLEVYPWDFLPFRARSLFSFSSEDSFSPVGRNPLGHLPHHEGNARILLPLPRLCALGSSLFGKGGRGKKITYRSTSAPNPRLGVRSPFHGKTNGSKTIQKPRSSSKKSRADGWNASVDNFRFRGKWAHWIGCEVSKWFPP